jgi:hypothetical protein
VTVLVQRGDAGLTVLVGESRNPVAIRHIGGGTFAVGRARFHFVRGAGGAVELHFESMGTPGHQILVR